MREANRFEHGLLSEHRAKGADILKAIRDDKELKKETEEKLKSFIEAYTKTFA